MSVNKSVLRDQIRARQAGLPAVDVRAHSASVWERLSVLPSFAAAQSVMTYVSHGNEIDTHGLIRQLLAMGRRVCVPAFVDEYVPAEIHDFDEDLAEGKFGILEPKSVKALQPEVWLVP